MLSDAARAPLEPGAPAGRPAVERRGGTLRPPSGDLLAPVAARAWLPAVLIALALALLGTAATGLLRPFPPLRGEPPTPARAELGRLLFFDPVLSRDRDLSCAHCHRPEHAFSDARPRALGRGGLVLARNTPGLYNVCFRERLFWDRRAASLEDQALGPLLSADEMGADPGELVARLRAIPEYRERFASAFVGESPPHVDLDRITRALAAFERTLVSRASRYDLYAAGERSAPSESERNGLRVFRSINTRCFECHRLPTFEAPLAMGIGVPSPDDGVGALSAVDAQRGQFAVPTLRNVARTAPYMHDGSIATLEEVIEFYREGGGRTRGVADARIHEFVRPFAISDVEARDLVTFLRALEDESARPPTPARVPSGLPVLAARSLDAAAVVTRGSGARPPPAPSSDEPRSQP
jgi:cytochrome c peroxidase